MKKLFAIVHVLVSIISFNAEAQQPPQLKQISDHVYAYIDITEAAPAINSYGANCGVVIGSEAVLVIDTLIAAKNAKRLINEIKAITDKPIKYAINTHHHPDHSWGNSEFSKLGATIIGQKNLPTTLEQAKQTLDNSESFGLTKEDVIGTTIKLPDILMDNFLQIDLGDIHVDLQYLGASHSIDSITAFIKEDNVLFVGDILFNKYHPFLGEGDIPNWTRALARLSKSKAKIIVPGHGPAATKKDIKEMSDYLIRFDKLAKKLSKDMTQNNAPEIAEKMLKRLPDQKRTEMPNLIEWNLRSKYLPQEETTEE